MAAMVEQVDPSKRKQEKDAILKKLEQEIYLNYNAYLGSPEKDKTLRK